MEQVLSADFRAGAWHVQPSLNRLVRDAEIVQVEPKVMQVLVCLADRAGEVVSRDELFEAVWAGTVVHDDVLSRSVSELRKVFDDDPRAPAYIETIRKSGYRLIAPVEPLHPAGPASGDGLPTLAVAGDGLATRPSRPARRVPPGLAILALTFLLLAVAGVLVWQVAVRPAAPGTPRPLRTAPLTTYPGHEIDPAFSPDGSRIAFAWDGPAGDNFDVYAKVVGTETPLRLTTDPAADRAPAWSPDGRYVAFVREAGGACSLMTVPATGGPERRLAGCGPDGFVRPTWLPGGELVYADRAGPGASYRLTFLDVETGRARHPVAPPDGSGGDILPAVSPDGTTLAFARLDERNTQHLYTMPLPDGPPRPIGSERFQKLIDLDWMPGGDRLVLAAYREGRLTLWQVPAAGGAVSWLALDGDGTVAVAVSPARRQLAYQQEASDDNIWRLSLVPDTPTAASFVAVPLVASTRWDSKPRYAPDGTRITFQSTRSGQHEIWVCDADGANAMALTAFGVPFTRDPSWSPDGHQVAFYTSLEGHDDVYAVDAAGGAPRRLTDHPAAERDPRWSPDGRWLYFRSDRGGATDVWRMPAGGGSAVQVSHAGAVAAFAPAAEGVVYYTRYDAPGLWRLDPATGGARRLIDDLSASDARNWTVVPDGVYYTRHDGPGRATLRHHRFDTGRAIDVAPLDGLSPFSGLSRSPDGRWLLFARTDRSESDLVLVDGL